MNKLNGMQECAKWKSADKARANCNSVCYERFK